MNKSIIHITIIVILLLLNGFLLVNINDLKSETKPQYPSLIKVHHKIEIASCIDGLSKIDTSCILEDVDSKYITLSKLLNDREKILILKISSLNCNTCIDKSIEILNSGIDLHKDMYNDGKVIILYEDSNIRNFVLLRRSVNSKIEIYQVKDQIKMKMKMNELNIPFFFVLDSNLHPQMIHVNNKEYPDFTSDYLNVVFNYLQNKNMNFHVISDF